MIKLMNKKFLKLDRLEEKKKYLHQTKAKFVKQSKREIELKDKSQSMISKSCRRRQVKRVKVIQNKYDQIDEREVPSIRGNDNQSTFTK